LYDVTLLIARGGNCSPIMDSGSWSYVGTDSRRYNLEGPSLNVDYPRSCTYASLRVADPMTSSTCSPFSAPHPSYHPDRLRGTSGGTLDAKARPMAAHAPPRHAALQPAQDRVTLDEVVKINIRG